MKKIITSVIIIVFFISFIGCNDQYFDVNTPTGTATEDQLRMNDLLGPVIFHTVNAQYWAERSFGNYSQNLTGQGGTSTGETSISGTWKRVYLYALPNLKTISKKAVENNATHFEAVAKILTAINIGLATDSWDNIPYSEASQGTANPKPIFDSQESVYNEIDALLTSAIAALEAPDDSGFAPNSNSDLIYGGDLTKWLRAAYTLKARYQLHLSKKNGVSAATAALASLANGFTSNADDFQMFYTEKNINPWYAREVLARNTGNSHDKIGDQLISYMNGSSYPFTTITEDPRLSELFVRLISTAPDVPSPLTDPWRGFVSGGSGLSSDGENGNVNFKKDGFHSRANSPLVIISYAEAQFIKAEAEFLVNGGNTTSVGTNTAAYTAYMNGIQANMDKLGVDATNYLADASIDLGEGNLMLQHIMKEKYIANFLNPETFVDLRRYDFSDNVFKDLALPADNIGSEFPGQWLVRAQYPSSEETRNPENVSSNRKDPVDPVWWAQ